MMAAELAVVVTLRTVPLSDRSQTSLPPAVFVARTENPMLVFARRVPFSCPRYSPCSVRFLPDNWPRFLHAFRFRLRRGLRPRRRKGW